MRKPVLFLFFLFCSVSAFAQFKASIQGTVTDPQGNAVVGAKITITDQSTQAHYSAVSNNQGYYRINEMPPGSYTVSAEGTGFKIAVSKDVVVEAEQPRGFDIALQVGATSEVVTNKHSGFPFSALIGSCNTSDDR